MQAEINFINLFERFWQIAPETDGFKSDYAALYFALIDSINRNSDGKNWKETEVEYDRIINKVRMGKRMFLEARNWLVNHQFLTYTPGRNEYSKARYFIVTEVQKRTATVTSSVSTTATTTVPTTDTAGVTEYIEKPLNLKTLNLETEKHLKFADSANSASESEVEKSVDALEAEKEKASPGSAAPPPSKPIKPKPPKEQKPSPFEKYEPYRREYKDGEGDGRLHQMLKEFYLEHIDLYPPELYREFKAYWSALMVNGKKAEIGKEKWEVQETWSLSGRLSTWHQNNLKNGSNQRFNQTAGLKPGSHPPSQGKTFGKL